MDVFDQISEVEFKIRQLIKKIERLETTNSSLEQDKQALQQELVTQVDKVKIFIDKVEQLQYQFEADGKLGNSNSYAHRIIENYFREVTRCIDWLSES